MGRGGWNSGVVGSAERPLGCMMQMQTLLDAIYGVQYDEVRYIH